MFLHLRLRLLEFKAILTAALQMQDLDLKTYVNLICSLLDIPVYDNPIESLHVLFTLFLEFKTNPFFRQHVDMADPLQGSRPTSVQFPSRGGLHTSAGGAASRVMSANSSRATPTPNIATFS